MSRASKAEKKAKKNAATISDQYDESSRVLTDAEAHRDVLYDLPSPMAQIMECFKVQMKRYTRQRVMWFCIVILALIPVIYLAIKTLSSPGSMLPKTDVANTYMAALLSVGPAIIPLLASIACGSMLSQEFNERTVYLSLPLPMSRSAFYIGKFLAGLILIEGTVAAAYGLSIIISLGETSEIYTGAIFVSFLCAACYAFFCCALAYALSTKSRRGSSMLPFVVLFIIIPLIGDIIMMFVKNDTIYTIASYFPCFLIDESLNVMGQTTFISMSWIISSMFYGSFVITCGTNILVFSAVTVLIALMLLFLGYRKVERRDM